METNHTRTCNQRIWAEAPFMATDLNSQKQSRREEGGWKRTVHQRQWHAQSSRRSKHARQHCSSFNTELRNITWKVCVPRKGITHSSETWWTCLQRRFRWTCLQGRDFRESVADSPLGLLSGLKFYFLNTTPLSLELTKPSKVYNLLTFNFACTFLLASFPVLLTIALFLESWNQTWGKLINQATSFQFLPMPDTELPNCAFTPTRTRSPRAGVWRRLLLITIWRAFLGPVFILFPRSDTHQIQGIPKPQFDLSQSGFSAETGHWPCLGRPAHPQRLNIILAFVDTPPPVPGEEPSDCPVHSV